jgi:hypothetical protein
MKNNSELKRNSLDTLKQEQLLNVARESDDQLKVSRHFKKFILLISLVGAGILFKGCMAGYVATEPSYVEFYRPAQPSHAQLWIEGDWSWNNRTHVYVQNTGYWTNPRQGQTYVSGYWKTTPRGKSWSKGHWQSNGRKGNNHKR